MRAAPALRLAVAAVAAALLTPVMASAQSPTPEGTVITNTATVSFTDANNNTYAAVQGSVNVTVGFSAGIDLVASAATATPAAPSSGNSLTFTVQNLGNGTDSVSISQTISVGSIVTVTAYVVNSTSYASLAALNTALSSTSIAANATLAITVQYSVAAGTGGQSTVLTLTGASRRTPATTDAAATTVSPVLSSGVAVTPDGSQLLQRVPSNGTNYTVTFTVTNSGTGTDGYNLVSSNTGSAITIVSVNGVAGTTTSIASVAAGASQSINVIYAVGTVANGTADTLRLRATSTTNGAVSDQGFADHGGAPVADGDQGRVPRQPDYRHRSLRPGAPGRFHPVPHYGHQQRWGAGVGGAHRRRASRHPDVPFHVRRCCRLDVLGHGQHACCRPDRYTGGG